MDAPVLADQQKLTFISTVQTLNAIKTTYQVQKLIGTDSERKSRESMLLDCFDNDDYY